jgi:hypothetical protein
MKKFLSIFAVLAFLILCGSLSVSAQTAISFSSPGTISNNGNWSLGWEFSTNTSLNVTALGFFDSVLGGGGYPGLATCTSCGAVGIYNSSGTLLVSTVVKTTGSQVGDFYFTSVSPTTLVPGQNYFIVEQTGNAGYAYGTLGFTVNPNINFITDQYISSDTLAFPTTSDGYTAADGGAWFGPNFEATGLAATPELNTIVLMFSGIALFASILALRQRP